jgi:hypothetical protein
LQEHQEEYIPPFDDANHEDRDGEVEENYHGVCITTTEVQNIKKFV